MHNTVMGYIGVMGI